ncbi:MAG: ABC transporter substrate-binding protein [Hyphomicrobiales bacterium]
MLSPALAFAYAETPSLEADVKAGKLPPVDQRVPAEPRVIDLKAMGREVGKPGGTIRTLIGGQKDIRFMSINGYARLVGYDEHLNFVPDILASYTVDEARIFTLKLRKGHRWSDGQPVTSEDFRYAWEDVMLNEDLNPGGVPRELLVDGKPPKFEVIDEQTVRFTWDKPNPDFLPTLAAPAPPALLLPAHYLKQFHKKYQDKDKLEKLVKASKLKNWKQLHIRMGRQNRPENPDLPTLDPWVNTTPPPAEQFVFVRNPYFHRVDTAGQQLPYVDKYVLGVSTTTLIPAKTGAGESDLQSRYIEFEDYTFLKEAEKIHPVKVALWKRVQGSRVSILPNLNYSDPVWRDIFRDVRFRRALSLAINRHEINQAVYFGLGRPAADTILPESPMFETEYAEKWAAFDPGEANRLLDEMGLTKRDEEGFRLLPDGRRLELIVETAGENKSELDVLELIHDHWQEIGVKLFPRSTQRDVFRSRTIGGQVMMGVWSGMDNGIPTADMNPSALAPTSEVQLQWPLWGIYYQSGGSGGQAPDLPEAKQLVDLLGEWRTSATPEERAAVWKKMLGLWTDGVYSIGTVASTLQPLVYNSKLRNVPTNGLFGYDPTAYLGVYMPDTFFYATEAQ